MEIEVTLQVVCEGKFVRGTRQVFDKNFGNWLPPEGPEIDGFKVFLVKGEKRLEITEFLTEHEERALYNEYLESQLEDGL